MELEINKVKNAIMNRIYTISLAFVVPLLLASLIRWFDMGWQDIFFLHISLSILFITLFLFKKKLTFTFKFHFLTNVFLIIGIVSLYFYNFAGAYYYCFLPILLSGILLGRKFAFIYLFIVALFFPIVAIGHFSKFFSNDHTINYLYFMPTYWFSHLVSIIYISVIISTASSKLYEYFTKTTQNLVQEIDKKERLQVELNKHQIHLENLVKIRTEELEKNKEELAFKVEELSLANKTKDKFFSIIAHDLSNLFGSFANLREIWNYYKEGAPEEHFVKILVSTQESAERGYNLFLNLLEWARTQTEKIEFQPQKLNLRELVEENCKLFSNKANKKSIRLNIGIPEYTIVFADKNMLNTILRNLISNALKFTPNFGEVEITSNTTKGFNEIIVSDNGVGIKEENISKLFRIDTKHKTLGTNQENGTGLGLILCKEFIDKHNGKIYLKSIQNKGTQFSIKLPNLPGVNVK